MPPILMLLGPTASGKSAASLAIARRHPVEIVSVDSALVYRGMDIGTAKPEPAELAAVPHHLIDILDPAQAYSAARFAADARRLCGEIVARGRLPLLVGGTMLYAKAFMGGLAPLPGADAAIRARLDAEAATQGWPALHARLATLDPVTAARLAPGDSQRIQRALEVFELTGRPLSALHAAPVADARPSAPPVVVSLEPSRREELHRRIAARFEAMIVAGLLDEVARLRARGDLHAGLPSMRAVGYRQAWTWLDEHPERDPLAMRDPRDPVLRSLLDRGVAATRQLAKRQLTWLRSMPDRIVVDCLDPSAEARVLAIAEAQWPPCSGFGAGRI
ncbi:MAG: tRNA (adenosine(37)-N6)-dimethylallyltransferase MiaA [Pseudomonadota bacterium]|nr:tRNA (adenosine(37)-N6)-dimethylallyltransferase MiaA [Pseudomonadota bacterium]